MSPNGETPGLQALKRSRELADYWPRGRKSKELDEALDEERAFEGWLQKNLNRADVKVVTATGECTTLADLISRRYEMTEEELRGLIEPYWAFEKLQDAGRAKSELRKERMHGVKKFTAAFQEFSHNFMEFVKLYSGMVDIMRFANDQAGGAAYGTLSVLFTIAAQKQQMENSLYSSIGELKDRLQEMQIFQSVYPDSHLTGLLVKVYTGILSFSRNATKYYKSAGRTRFLRAMAPDEFNGEVDTINGSIVEVRFYCGALLAKRVKDVELKLDDANEMIRGLHIKSDGLKAQNTEANSRLQDLQCKADSLKEQNEEANGKINELLGKSDELKAQNEALSQDNIKLSSQLSSLEAQASVQSAVTDRDQLSKILSHHKLPRLEEDKHRECIQRCHSYLSVFKEDQHRTRMDLHTLQSLPIYAQWSSTPCSSLLLLTGKNEQTFIEQAGGKCWLSPAAIELIQDHLAQGHPVTYELCLHTAYQQQKDDPTAREIMASFCIQLLGMFPHILRNSHAFQQLEQIRIDPERKGYEIDDLTELLLTILNLIQQSEPVYIVLDRMDRCQSKGAKLRVLKALLRVARETRCWVKIMVVVCAHFWNVDEYLEDLDVEKMEKDVFNLMQLNQQFEVPQIAWG